MTSTFTPALALELPSHGDYASTGWDNPMDNSLRQLDTAYGGMLTLPVTSGTVILTTAQASNPVIYVTGTLTGNVIVAFPPTVAGRRLIIPGCVMGNFNLYVRGNNGTDQSGVYFWSQFSIPYGIVVTPSRVYWDYGAIHVGQIVDYPLTFPCNGWLPCDGRYVSQISHDLLYDLIGGTYGISGGSFKLPDLRGTVTAMADQIGTVPAAGPFAFNAGNRGILNSWGVTTFAGEANHTLSIAEMPSHAHPGSADSGHGHGITDSGHAHTVGGSFGGGLGQFAPPSPLVSQGAIATSSNATGVQVQTGHAAIAVAAQGGGGVHNNVQPTTATMKMIKW